MVDLRAELQDHREAVGRCIPSCKWESATGVKLQMPPKGKLPENSQAKGPLTVIALWKVGPQARADGVSKHMCLPVSQALDRGVRVRMRVAQASCLPSIVIEEPESP